MSLAATDSQQLSECCTCTIVAPTQNGMECAMINLNPLLIMESPRRVQLHTRFPTDLARLA